MSESTKRVSSYIAVAYAEHVENKIKGRKFAVSSLFIPGARLQTKGGIRIYLGDISEATYENWRKAGVVPGPVPGTDRYDVVAHDARLDSIQIIEGPPSALERWKAAKVKSER